MPAPLALAKKTKVNPAADRALIEEYARIEGAKLHVALPGGATHFIEMKESSAWEISTPTGPALATTDCRDAAGKTVGPAVACLIEIAVEPHTKGEIRLTLAHEVFHCYEAVMSGTLANDRRAGDEWLTEGAAEWAGSELVHHNEHAQDFWRSYLRSPTTALFTRTYSAIGFFGHMASSGLSPWKYLPAMFAATTNDGAWAAGVRGSLTFLDSEASVFFRNHFLGRAWEEYGPNIPSAGAVGYKPPVKTIGPTSRKSQDLTAAPYADSPWTLSIAKLPKNEPVVELRLRRGYARIAATKGGTINKVITGPIVICNGSSKECQCPSDHHAYEQLKQGDLAITGGSEGGDVTISRRAPCDVVLPLPGCQWLLTGFSLAASEGIGKIVGGSPSLGTTVSSPGGSQSSDCGLLEKGHIEPETGDFVGVFAPFVQVLRAPTDAGAEMYYKLVAPALGALVAKGYGLSYPGLGDESELASGNSEGFGSEAILREDNIVVFYGLVSTVGNYEADEPESLRLLREVASRL